MDEYGFEARLRHLEHIIAGQNQPKTVQIAVLKRVETLRKELHSVYKNNKSIRDFVEKYDAHSKLLNPNTSTYSLEREILAPDAKLELILAAQDDLEKFASEVNQVKALEYVVGSSEFEAVDNLGPQLAPLEVSHLDQKTNLSQLTDDISQLMERYNGTINTLSEIFISWDNILSTMEGHVSALERQKKADETIP
ncbi:hypothetical protein K501DRAFT_255572 [Backusella circina FSU 941]|nr:hypothetical protein K501DRAFT_255572 [Backusella circina FSU 941]